MDHMMKADVFIGACIPTYATCRLHSCLNSRARVALTVSPLAALTLSTVNLKHAAAGGYLVFGSAELSCDV